MTTENKLFLLLIIISWIAIFLIGYELSTNQRQELPDDVVLFDFDHNTVTVKLPQSEMDRAKQYTDNNSNIYWQFNFTEIKQSMYLNPDFRKSNIVKL